MLSKIFFVFTVIILIFFSIAYFSPDPAILGSGLSKRVFPLINSNPTPTPAKTVTFSLEGDLGLGRYITSTARSKKDFFWSFQNVSPILQSTDFNLANLESPIINNCPQGKTGTFIFCGDSQFLPYLKQNKFIFNLANNHILNYGQDGFSQTKNYLNQNQLDYFYSHNPDTEFLKKEINGITFGFLGYDFITHPKLDPNQIITAVKKYDSQVDWLIISLHWGNEYLPKPETWRVDLAHQLVDAGADIIHGHHPHVLQTSEIYQGKPIFYSLGNFIFDQNWSKETSNSEMVILKVTKNEILENIVKPFVIKFNSQPQFIN